MALELVDQKGSLWDAVRRIRELARVRPEESLTLDYGVRLGVFERLLVMLGVERPRGASTLEGLSDTLRPVVDGLSMLLTLHEAPLQARLPFHLEVQ